eukprot:GHVR01118717.1.p1 GENE.GHVR01118717.1~~GHVR01118717.1.p1  ORF type:complete len:251 (+),score=57.39 GHVR01118717.1:565-1317(+)
MLSYSLDESDLEGGLGLYVGRYGVRVDRDLDDLATAVEVVARSFEIGTLIDRRDREYGARIKLRNFEFSMRHDFFDIQDPLTNDNSYSSLATELFFGWRSFGVSVGSDFINTRYGVSVSMLGYECSMVRDFDERITDTQVNWGNYQLALNGDFVDPFSRELYGRVGFGRLGRAWVSAGAGVGNDGVPQSSFQVESPNAAVGFDFIEDGKRLYLFSVSVGKFTYVWESATLLSNVKLPQAAFVLPGSPVST